MDSDEIKDVLEKLGVEITGDEIKVCFPLYISHQWCILMESLFVVLDSIHIGYHGESG